MNNYKVSKLSERRYLIKFNINEETYQVISNLRSIMALASELEGAGFKNLKDTKELALMIVDSYPNVINLKKGGL